MTEITLLGLAAALALLAYRYRKDLKLHFATSGYERPLTRIANLYLHQRVFLGYLHSLPLKWEKSGANEIDGCDGITYVGTVERGFGRKWNVMWNPSHSTLRMTEIKSRRENSFTINLAHRQDLADALTELLALEVGDRQPSFL